MLCPKKVSSNFIFCLVFASMQPNALPASPGFGNIHILSNLGRILLFATQFNATPPAYATFGPYFLAFAKMFSSSISR